MAKIDYNFLVRSVLDELQKNKSFYNEVGENKLLKTLRVYFDREAEKELKKLHKRRISDKQLGIDIMEDQQFYIYAQEAVMEILMNKAIALGKSSVKEERSDIL